MYFKAKGTKKYKKIVTGKLKAGYESSAKLRTSKIRRAGTVVVKVGASTYGKAYKTSGMTLTISRW